MHRGLGLVLVGVSIGCGPMVVPGDGDGSGSAGSDDATPPATTTAVTATTATTLTTTSTTGTTTASTTADDADDADDVDDGILWDCGAAPPGSMQHCTVPKTCEPRESGVLGWLAVDDGLVPTDPVPEPYVYACTITGASEDAGLSTYALACADGPHTLAIASSVGISFDTTGDFLLSVIYEEATSESSGWLVTLRRAGGELVLAGGASAWSPDAVGVPSGFFDPLVVTLEDEICPVERPPDGFIGGCYALERQALELVLGNGTAQVFDQGSGELPPYVVLVQHAEERHEITCSDIADSHYSWIVVPPLPG